jgi:hypothetical protein
MKLLGTKFFIYCLFAELFKFIFLAIIFSRTGGFFVLESLEHFGLLIYVFLAFVPLVVVYGFFWKKTKNNYLGYVILSAWVLLLGGWELIPLLFLYPVRTKLDVVFNIKESENKTVDFILLAIVLVVVPIVLSNVLSLVIRLF